MAGIRRNAGASDPQQHSGSGCHGGSVSDSLELLAKRTHIKVSPWTLAQGSEVGLWASVVWTHLPGWLGGRVVRWLVFLGPFSQPVFHVLVAGVRRGRKAVPKTVREMMGTPSSLDPAPCNTQQRRCLRGRRGFDSLLARLSV